MRNVSLLLSLLFVLTACGHDVVPDGDSGINVYPANYKSDILAAMHAYLNNPTGIRDAVISEPTLKWSGNVNRYVTCLQFTRKKTPANMAAPERLPPCSWADGWIDLSICRKPSALAQPMRHFRSCKTCRRKSHPGKRTPNLLLEQ